MASGVKYENFVEDLANQIHDLFGTTHELRVVLTNSAPNVATHEVLADVTQVANGGGYTTGGEDTQNDGTRSGGTVSVTGVDVVFTGSGGGFGPFRYVVLYNTTPSSPADPLIQYWDYGSSISVLASETFTVDFGATVMTIT